MKNNKVIEYLQTAKTMSPAAKQLRGIIINQILKSNPELEQRLIQNMEDKETLSYINSMCEAIIQTPDFIASLQGGAQ